MHAFKMSQPNKLYSSIFKKTKAEGSVEAFINMLC